MQWIQGRNIWNINRIRSGTQNAPIRARTEKGGIRDEKEDRK